MKRIWIFAGIIIVLLSAFWAFGWYRGKTAPSVQDVAKTAQDRRVAYVSGGCFWCTEHDLEGVDGVIEAVSGYMGGTVQNPSYNQVSTGATGHRETVKVVYDPSKVTYQHLVFELLRETDPTDAGGTFHDRGHQYTSAIYYKTDEEKRIALHAIEEIDAKRVFEKPIVTSVEPAGEFFVAETYHQDYAKKNPLQYSYYRNASGRDAFIEKVWGEKKYGDFFSDPIAHTSNSWESFKKSDDAVLRKTLTPLQYSVTQLEGTERPFQNEYWNNHEQGIYVDVVSGEPLFSSTDKFESGTGWPSFLKPLSPSVVTEHDDYKLFVKRTEIRSKYADSHLGHIILDGPAENNFIRYCMNSASLRFIPKAELQDQGLEQYLKLF